MNRFVPLLLVALSLATTSLARPAQAQWVKGLPYFLNSNTQGQQPGTMTNAAIRLSTNAHVSITSTPDLAGGIYSTGGTYNGSAGIYYVWMGGSLTQTMSLSMTQEQEATGNGPGNGNSKAGNLAYGDSSINNGVWDSKATVTNDTRFAAGTTPTSQNQTVVLSANTTVYYNSARPGSTIVTADVTLMLRLWFHPLNRITGTGRLRSAGGLCRLSRVTARKPLDLFQGGG